MTARASSTRRSRTSTRPSSSIRRTRAPTTTAASPIATSGDIGSRHRRLQPGAPLRPDYALALYNRGIAYYDKREFDSARATSTRRSSSIRISRPLPRPRHRLLRQARLRPSASPWPIRWWTKPSLCDDLQRPRRYENRREGDRIIRDANPAIHTTNITPMPIRRTRTRRRARRCSAPLRRPKAETPAPKPARQAPAAPVAATPQQTDIPMPEPRPAANPHAAAQSKRAGTAARSTPAAGPRVLLRRRRSAAPRDRFSFQLALIAPAHLPSQIGAVAARTTA